MKLKIAVETKFKEYGIAVENTNIMIEERKSAYDYLVESVMNLNSTCEASIKGYISKFVNTIDTNLKILTKKIVQITSILNPPVKTKGKDKSKDVKQNLNINPENDPIFVPLRCIRHDSE